MVTFKTCQPVMDSFLCKPRARIKSKSWKPAKDCPKVRRLACRRPPDSIQKTSKTTQPVTPGCHVMFGIHDNSCKSSDVDVSAFLVHVLPNHKLRVFKQRGCLAVIGASKRWANIQSKQVSATVYRPKIGK